MKKIVLTFTILFTLIYNVSAQTEKVNGKKYYLKAKLIKEVEIHTCGYFAFANFMEFEILTFSDSTYTNKTIPVVVTCPDFKGKKFFRAGKIYNLVLADKNQAEFNWTMQDFDGLREKYKLDKDFWTLSIEKE